MRNFLSRYFIVIPLAAMIGLAVFSHSCANTTQAPTGGPKDTIPPVLLKVNPLPGKTGVPTHGTKVYFGFNEYVTVKEPKSIYLSPPQAKAPKFRIKGRGIEVYFEEDLLPNTTYTLDITNAVADNNEGNMFPGFTMVFSTGDSVDSLFVTGTVRDCNSLLPLKGATVMLYKDHSDSAVFLRRPDASIKTDDWGFFCVRNIQDTLFRLYAIMDANNNNVYDPDEDRIAFLDTAIRPVAVVNDSSPELLKYDMKDTVHCLARNSEYNLSVFKERPSKQMVMNSKRTADRAAYVTFMAPDTRIDSLWFHGYPASNVITEFNVRRDSLCLWLNDQRRTPDTLKLGLKFWKTDTLGVLVPVTETLDLVDENRLKNKRERKRIEHADTVCALNLIAEPTTVEQDGMRLEFSYPPIFGQFDSLKFWSVNPRQQSKDEKFTIERDSMNLRLYHVKPGVRLQVGWDYHFKIPERTFRDINGYWNDSTDVKVSLPTEENLSSLTLNVTGVNGTRYIVDMLDEKRTKVLRSYVIDNDQSLAFPYISAGKYSVRVTEDRNRNGIVDTGDLLSHRQPEKVIFLDFNKSEYIDIPEKTDIAQDVDFNELFK